MSEMSEMVIDEDETKRDRRNWCIFVIFDVLFEILLSEK